MAAPQRVARGFAAVSLMSRLCGQPRRPIALSIVSISQAIRIQSEPPANDSLTIVKKGRTALLIHRTACSLGMSSDLPSPKFVLSDRSCYFAQGQNFSAGLYGSLPGRREEAAAAGELKLDCDRDQREVPVELPEVDFRSNQSLACYLGGFSGHGIWRCPSPWDLSKVDHEGFHLSSKQHHDPILVDRVNNLNDVTHIT